MVFPLLLGLPLLTTAIAASQTPNFTSCHIEIKEGLYGPFGGTDASGHTVSNISEAVGITYDLCLDACGHGHAATSWPVFSRQFNAYLLPWLALLSQLPYSSPNPLDDIMSVVLAVGSPTLAAYSLAITILNYRWLRYRFGRIARYPNVNAAILILNALQQSPINITLDNSLLSSLIVLPSNDLWWQDLAKRLRTRGLWSIQALCSIGWVYTAYIFTAADTFLTMDENFSSQGQAVGSAWLWLVAVVVGWQVVSPRSNMELINEAVAHANDHAFVAPRDSGSDPIRAKELGDDNAIWLLVRESAQEHDRDFRRSPPIYNYARLWKWTRAAERVAMGFERAAENARSRKATSESLTWALPGRDGEIHERNRTGSAAEVDAYCGIDTMARDKWASGPHVLTRIVVASCFAIWLQWGTTGAAMLMHFLTPTVGLSCRSGSYLIYGLVSTLVWFMILLSSVSAHYSDVYAERGTLHSRFLSSVCARIATTLRRAAKFGAILNAVWILLTVIFQFVNLYDTCWCRSSVLGLGKIRAYAFISMETVDMTKIRDAWAGGLTLANGTVVAFLSFVYFAQNDNPTGWNYL